jgi:phosphoribosylamine--glycine ligase
MASKGYPGSTEKGKPIVGLEEAGRVEGAVVFHCGTRKGTTGEILTTGGRVLSVSATAATIEQAAARAYEAVSRIRFEGEHHRTDIAAKAIERIAREREASA